MHFEYVFLFVCFFKEYNSKSMGFFFPHPRFFKVKQSNLVYGWLLETLLFPKCHFKSVKLSIAILVVKTKQKQIKKTALTVKPDPHWLMKCDNLLTKELSVYHR